MRKDLDRLMQERRIAGMVVIAHDRYTPAMYYAIGQKVHHGIYFRAASGNAHLIHDPMERDQAAAAGCEHSSFAQHGYAQLVEKEGRPSLAMAKLIADTCAQLGMNGPIAYFGDMGAAYAYEVLDRVRELNPALTVDRSHPDILTIARTTKDEDEVASIRHAAEGAVSAIRRLREYLGGLTQKGESLHANGSGPVTLGQLRRLLHEEFLAYGLEGGETIVSQGRDAGVPHNRGNDAAPLLLGVPLLVDIFPGEAGGGYFSDLTRTFSVGPPKPEFQKLFDDVEAAHRLAMDSLEVGAPCRSYQEKVCDLFEKRGHATLRTNDGAQEGYVHGLGHGVGLAVHEAPRLGGPPSNTQTLEPGMVITVEPGLYYPSRGLGVRIEDLVLVRPDGAMENLTPAPYGLIVEPRG